MKKKIKCFALTALSLLMISSCSTTSNPSDTSSADDISDTTSNGDSNSTDSVSGGDTSSSINEEIGSIKIVKDSIVTSTTLNSTIDYSGLKIDVFNIDEVKLNTLLASEHKDEITYNTIDTSTSGDKTFTVNYKNFKDSITIKVLEKQYVISSVTANKNYSYTVGIAPNNKLSTSETEVETGFMEKITYHIGNLNSVDLMPTVVGIDEDDPLGSSITLDKIPSNSEVTVKDSTNKELALSDVFDNVDDVKSYAKIKFKDTITSGTYSLTYKIDTYTVTYNMTVVNDAWNVTTAVDLFALHSAKTNGLNWDDAAALKKYKEDNNLPYASSLVFQNDVTINKSDIPDFFFWKESEHCDSTVVGSFKDWRGFISYVFTKENEVVSVYGNGHKLALNNNKDDSNAFPKAITDEQSGAKQKEGQPVTSHSSIFYSSAEGNIDPSKVYFNVYDLEYSGNASVSKESDITKAGEMFCKFTNSSNISNVLVNGAYIGIDLNGWQVVGSEFNINNTRINDSFHTAIYNYNNGIININHCDIKQSGGPLMFANPECEDLSQVIQETKEFSSLKKSTFNINDSFLSNWTAGAGAWYDAYQGASELGGSIKALDAVFNAQLGMGFTTTDSSTGSNIQKFNLLFLNLPIHNTDSSQSGESLGLPANGWGTNVDVYYDNELVYSTLNGFSSFMEGAQKYMQGGGTTALLSALSYTDVGDNYFGNIAFKQANQNILTFRKQDSKGVPHFTMVNTGNYGGYQLYNTAYTIAQTAGVADPTQLGISADPDDTFKTEGVLGANIQIQGFDGGLSADEFVKYHGVCNYGIILGQYHSLTK